MEPDFIGYATKAGLKCTDGRTIVPDAFKHMDGKKVPLVWNHGHGDVKQVLGYAILKAQDGHVLAHGYFNGTDSGKQGKALVQHKDIETLSIYANKLVERSKQVFHGMIREVSLVMAGANPGAVIEHVNLEHSDGSISEIEDEAIIFTGLELIHSDEKSSSDNNDSADDKDKSVEHAEEGTTAEDVYETLTEEQKAVVHAMIGAAIEAAASGAVHSDTTKTEGDLEHQEGSESMTRNVFENNGKDKTDEGGEFAHADLLPGLKDVMSSAVKANSESVMKAAKEYALEHGINNIEELFPEAKLVTTTPDFDKRRTEWVADVLNKTKKLPWSRIKNLVADITVEEARALGYIKGNMKKEEWFGISGRTTTPTTVYKKQGLDRDDIVDITDFDVVAWLWGEMRLMIEEEIARAILIGDGRPVEDPANPGQPNPDKIKDPQGAAEGAGIRSIANDHELYAPTVTIAAGGTPANTVDAVVSEMGLYKGSGTPTAYMTRANATKLMLARDGMGRRLYRTKAELADELMVDRIVEVEVMESAYAADIFAIIVNLADYSVGTTRGGQLTTFDDFDIDYNKYKYLIETRLSGALTKIRSALVIRWADAGDTLATPEAPTFNGTQVSIPTVTGVVYKNAETDAVITTAGSPYAVAEGDTMFVKAEPDATHYFANNTEDEWDFTNEA